MTYLYHISKSPKMGVLDTKTVCLRHINGDGHNLGFHWLPDHMTLLNVGNQVLGRMTIFRIFDTHSEQMFLIQVAVFPIFTLKPTQMILF